jgi:PiT family inorganic phosphate transporter
MITPLLVTIVALALAFDFINGFHDAANSIATIVSTKVLTPFQAVLWAAFFNFLVYFVIKDHKIANTIAKTVNEQFITLHVILSALIAAISWNLVTWWFGIPSSSSHALIGGFAGAGIAGALSAGASAVSAVNMHYVVLIIAYIVLAPLIGLAIAYLVTMIVTYLSSHLRPALIDRGFKGAQLISSAALSFAHGGNDAQKVMAIIYVALIAAKVIDGNAAMPDWIPLCCYTMIALGTMSGGWRIVKTMGTKITRLTPLKGVSAETAGAVTLLITEHFGIPVSTTHTLTGAIIGTGLTKNIAAIRWPLVHKMAWAWIITIPVSGTLAAGIYAAIHLMQ